jgi:filamentous hemagglutinin family protein
VRKNVPAKFLNVLRDRRQRARPAPEGPALRNRSPWRPSLGVATGLLAGFLAATAHAGDLLRGGAAYGQKNGAAAQLPGAAAASAAKANAQDILARTTQALQSIQNLQQAASVLGSGSNNAGLNPVGGGVLPNVPNGLTPGGLQVAPGATPGSALWQGANLPTHSTKGGLTTVSVNQTAAQATLTWQTFNIGRHTLLQFDQDLAGNQTSDWVVFNIVNDPSGVPSQILGSIQANGQVYVVNRNGIIFGAGSQVNTHIFVASSLPINQSLISGGLLNLTLTNPNLSFLFSSATDTGPVDVEAGATLYSPPSSASVGGRVALVGSTVTNNGTIDTPDGQTILAAGLQVGMTAHPTTDPTLRGLDVFVGNVDAGSGIATNNGWIEAQEASVLITGKQVNQNGVIDSGTSVTLNGRVDLLANYNAIPNVNYSATNATNGPAFLPLATGTVTLGAGSVTQILPDLASTATVAGTQLALPSIVNIQGKVVYFGANSILLAPGAILPTGAGAVVPLSSVPVTGTDNYSLVAGVTVSAGNWVEQIVGTTPTAQFEYTGGQIYVDHGAIINVAGTTNVAVPVAQNILSLQLRGGELANSSVQQNGVLRAVTINVDTRITGDYNGAEWIGTPLGNVWGYYNLIERTVGQLTTAGGTVALDAGQSVVLQTGSTVNVSGGYINYQGGMVQTTMVMSDGQLYPIADATPNRVYQGIYTGRWTDYHPAWGVANQFNDPLAPTTAHYEQSYVQGAAGGQISISAPSMALDGTLLGTTVTGPHQESSAPAASTLAITVQGYNAAGNAYSPTPANIVFQSNASLAPANPFALDASGNPLPLRADRESQIILSPNLFTQDGFATISIYDTEGNISIPAETTLKTAPGGAISFSAANIDIEGHVITPAGSQSYTTYNYSPYAKPAVDLPSPNAGRGQFTLGDGATLSAAGLTVDDRESSATAFQNPLVATAVTISTPATFVPPSVTAATTSMVNTVNGGSVSVQSFFTNLSPGSTIDVSGGVAFSTAGARTFGNGGSINIRAGQDAGWSSMLGGNLNLGATLKGYSGTTTGGSLSITAPLIQIGGIAAPGTLLLSPQFFSEGGFTSFALSGIGGLTPSGAVIPAIVIAPNTLIEPEAESFIAESYGGPAGTPVLKPILEPMGIRPPVSLTFNSLGFTNTDPNTGNSTTLFRGDFVMNAGAIIKTDPQISGIGGVSINPPSSSGKANVLGTATILGQIIAPGGTISVNGSPQTAEISGDPSPVVTVYLGPQSLLSTAGTTVLIPDNRGYRGGYVLAGGTINVSGNIVADAGARLDVSGTSGILDLPPADVGASTPLLGALSGTMVAPPARGTDPAYNGSIIPGLVGGSTAFTGLNGSFSGHPVMPVRIESNGGSITLTGSELLINNATLLGNPGGPNAIGGTLTVSSGLYPSGGTFSATTPDLIVTQTTAGIPQPYHPPGQTVVGNPAISSSGASISGLGYFAANTFMQGGFSSLTLGGNVEFSGPVSITAADSLSVATGGVIIANSAVHLTAPYVVLGQPFQTPVPENTPFNSYNPGFISPTFGPGTLTVTASLIDVGNLSLQGVGQLNLVAPNGDIRGDGTLDVSGHILLQAGQVYPATATTFTIVAYDPDVLVASSNTGSPAVTLASPILPPGFGIGSPLLGSTVQSINGVTVTLVANANATITAPTGVTFDPGAGSVTVVGAGARPLPLSAAGTLNIFASNITQGGTLRAPLGTINLGWDGTGTSPQDAITGAGVSNSAGTPAAPNVGIPIAQHIILSDGSVTSVSAINPSTGQGVIIPDGFNVSGTEWIDATGVNLVAGTVPGKAVNISGLNVSDQSGSTIDVRGGGDLYAYQWVVGNGGSNDILGTANQTWSSGTTYAPGTLVTYKGQTWSAQVATTGIAPSISEYWTLLPNRYAVLPGYDFPYAPYAANSTNASTQNLASADPGYVNSTLQVGDQIYLSAADGLRAGFYTLLPARYALLPGAFMVTPVSGNPEGNFVQTDGSAVVGGFRFISLNPSGTGQTLVTQFDIASGAVTRTLAQYNDYFASSYLASEITQNGIQVPRLPNDAGTVAISGDNSLVLQGMIEGQAPKGQAANIDISTANPDGIYIGAVGTNVPAGATYLSAALLNSYGAESLLIGGLRSVGANGTTITVNTPSIEVNNSGTPLTGPEIILVASQSIKLDPGAAVIQEGTMPYQGQFSNPIINIGNAADPGSGDGVLLRVGEFPAQVVRSGVDASNIPTISIGAGAQVGGYNLTIDSTATTLINPAAILSGRNVSLDAARISVVFPTTPGTLQLDPGLVLEGAALNTLAGASTLSLTGYSSIDLYGSGTYTFGGLALHTPDLRGPNGGTLTIDAGTFSLDNVSETTGSGPIAPPQALAGTLTVNTSVATLGQGQVNIDQYASVALNASSGLLFQNTGGLNVPGNLTITTPLITGTQLANQTITVGGNLLVQPGAGAASSTLSSGLAATLSLSGATVTENGNILLPSGTVNLTATGAAGALTVNGKLNVNGLAENFYNVTEYTDAGQINLTSNQGGVTINTGAVLDVAAQPGGGNAGTLSVTAPNGQFTVADNTMFGQAGVGGTGGNFVLDVNSVPGNSVAPIDTALDAGGFTQSRNYRIATGDITVGNATALNYTLSTDSGDIAVNGTINASGPTGGSITLIASGSVNLANGSVLNAAGLQGFNSAGQGGSVSLEAGSETGGTLTLQALGSGPQVNIQTGSTINLSVAGNIPATTVAAAANTAVNLPSTDHGVDVITTSKAGTITFADGTTAAIAANTPTSVANALSVTLNSSGNVTFAGSAGLGQRTGTLLIRAPQDSSNTDLQVQPINGTILNASQITLVGYVVYQPAGGSIDSVEGAVLANGNTFVGPAGTTTATYTTMLNRLLPGSQYAAYAGGTLIAPGAEIVNPSGDLTLASSWDLSTYRFGPKTAAGEAAGQLTLRASGNLIFDYQASLNDGFSGANYLAKPLAAGTQSWSYNLVAGADFTAANPLAVQSLAAVGANSGSLLLGSGSPALPTAAASTRDPIVSTYWQTIRTGTGSINIATGNSVELLDTLATIYTAGTQSATMGDFTTPNITYNGTTPGPEQQPLYGIYYTMDGGNISITAQNNIGHYLQSGGTLIADSSAEMPNNWLYRRGYVNPATGQFGAATKGGGIASTTWWVDFSNFYEGVGALGGGNVTLNAGNNIDNVDAVIPTNARMPKGVPSSQNVMELGGGNLVVTAGNNINGGVYYVERGQGTLSAGNQIVTNSTRADTSLNPTTADELPTSLFLGAGSFSINARGSILLGGVVNPFLLPSSLINSYYNRSYFSTYASTDAVTVSSLTGDVTLQDSPAGGGSLYNWYSGQLLGYEQSTALAASQPWLNLSETSITQPLAFVVMPPTLDVTAFSGNINLVGGITLAPSPTGNLSLLSAGSINGLQINSISSGINEWATSVINVSDANPASIPGITSPNGFGTASPVSTNQPVLTSFSVIFAPSGSSQGIYSNIQNQGLLNDSSTLHANDSTPIQIYATGGNISGITLFTPKITDVLASQDITDVAFYLQNVSASNVSVVSAGRDIILYDANSPLRQLAQAPGNALSNSDVGTDDPGTGTPTAGDIQINGPGSLEVLAGRNLDLGDGPNFVDGTGVGITSIGNARNPFLPFGSASITAMAGVGGPGDLSNNSNLQFAEFITKNLSSDSSYLTELGIKKSDYDSYTPEQKDQVALDVFYLILRDAGRAQTAGTGSYSTGFDAISALFGMSTGMGNITTQSRSIITTSGGNIDLAAPNGSVTLQTALGVPTETPPGIVTQDGGNVNIFTNGNVNLGISRIFTLRGGNIIIWSSDGNIAAGSSPKTVQSAPPTRILIDPISANVDTDLAGLATGGGIGVLATVANVPPGNVDLIAPSGVVDAGDAGIRATGNLNIAATKVLNANNIQVSGTSSGTPAAATVAAPNIGGLSGANAATAANTQSSTDATKGPPPNTNAAPEADSSISVEVLGYGGGDGPSDSSGTSTSGPATSQ